MKQKIIEILAKPAAQFFKGEMKKLAKLLAKKFFTLLAISYIQGYIMEPCIQKIREIEKRRGWGPTNFDDYNGEILELI